MASGAMGRVDEGATLPFRLSALSMLSRACTPVMKPDRSRVKVIRMSCRKGRAATLAVFASLVFRDFTSSVAGIAAVRSEGIRIRRW